MTSSEPPVFGDVGASGPSAVPPALRLVFVGPNGIRAGWRLLIFTVVAAFFGVVLSAPLLLTGPHRLAEGKLSPAALTLGEGLLFLACMLAAMVMAALEGRSFAEYGLSVRDACGAKFWQGALWGFGAVTALLLALWGAHGFSFGSRTLSGTESVSYAAGWAAGFLAVAFFEEFLFRGYALYTLTTGIGFWPAALLLSALFGGVHLHNAGETWIGGLAAGLIGLFFCFTVRRTGSLWFAIGLHGMWDYSQSFVYSVPDSGAMVPGHLLNSSFHGPTWLTGGTVGPEGSALVFVVIAALFVVFDRLYRDARFPG
ncbi:MAG: CPBP family intramembrane metalloprotease domain-containing protein [Acidobacteria bacterium]|nr:MAG: CPBP family intramembrane metalloprotease domain-containing protein [Acidobacteriota bacterium]